jgi:hypothetical protein
VSCDVCGQLTLRDQAALRAFEAILARVLVVRNESGEIVFATPDKIGLAAFVLADEFMAARGFDEAARSQLATIGAEVVHGSMTKATALAAEYREWSDRMRAAETIPPPSAANAEG